MRRPGYVVAVAVLLLLAAFAWPATSVIPVQGASSTDWNPESFWYEPWGSSGVHKGIDVFAEQGTPVIASSPGFVLFSGSLAKGGEVLLVLSPGWRLFYYAHLSERHVGGLSWVAGSEVIGTVGDTGNAVGKPPHLHFAVVSMIPYPWLASSDSQGWKRMFYLNPVELFANAG